MLTGLRAGGEMRPLFKGLGGLVCQRNGCGHSLCQVQAECEPCKVLGASTFEK